MAKKKKLRLPLLKLPLPLLKLPLPLPPLPLTWLLPLLTLLLPLLRLLTLPLLLLPPSNRQASMKKPAFGPVFFRLHYIAVERPDFDTGVGFQNARPCHFPKTHT